MIGNRSNLHGVCEGFGHSLASVVSGFLVGLKPDKCWLIAAGRPTDKRSTGVADRLTIANYWPYATTLFDYIRRAMPWTQPRSLTDDEVYALTAYILAQNKLIDARETMNAQSLPKVQMPNRNGFIGSLRKESINRKVANAPMDLAPLPLKLNVVGSSSFPSTTKDAEADPPPYGLNAWDRKPRAVVAA